MNDRGRARMHEPQNHPWNRRLVDGEAGWSQSISPDDRSLCDWRESFCNACGRGRLELVEKLLTAMIWVGALGGWSDPTSHRLGALQLICRPAAGGRLKAPTGRAE
jgi:hypothetical protein